MSQQIRDGEGNGRLAGVNSSNRLKVDAVTRAIGNDASNTGDSYNVNTGSITLTSANKSAMLYIKNTGGKRLIVENIFYLIGNSTGGSGNVTITVLRNPTAGTIVSGASNVEMNANRNFGSSKSFDGVAYKGAEGNTFTDGTKAIESIFNQAPKREALGTGTLVLERGNSIGVDVTPATGNTSCAFEIAMAIHVEEDE